MDFINLSERPLIFKGDKTGLKKMIVLPDYCPGRGILPVGVVGVYEREVHKITSDYLGPDVGCGMMLARFKKQPLENLRHVAYSVASELELAREEEGTLGGGNHFLNIYEVTEVREIFGINPGDNVVLIHTGCRTKGQEIYIIRYDGKEYLKQHDKLVRYAAANRKALLKRVERLSKNELEVMLDLPHNTVEVTDENVIYRKGATRLSPGEFGVIPSSMAGEAVVVKARKEIEEIENSSCHGTGRKISRSKAREIPYNFDALRKKVYIPSYVDDEDIMTENPDCYNDLDWILDKMKKYVDVVARMTPKAVVVQ